MTTIGSRTAWHRLVLLLLVALVVSRLVAMAILPLADTTEARYGEIGRKMAELGDWVTPWADVDVPFWGKPPLSFWLTAASFGLFGVGEFAARLPHFVCGLLAAALVWDMARRRDRREAALAVAVLAGSALFYVSAGAVMTDGVLVLGTTLAMVGFWLALHGARPRVRRHGGWAFFAGIAAGLLGKGPVALVLIGFPLLAWTVAARGWGAVRRGLPWGPGILLALLLVTPWYALAELRTPGFLRYFLAGEHWHRFLTPGWQGDLYGTAHRRAPGTIWLFGLQALLPWSLLLPAAWFTRRRDGDAAAPAEREWRRYLVLWALTPLLFFTAARNIIWTYALPGLPAASLLVAGWLARRSANAERWAAAGLALSLLAAGALLTLRAAYADHSAKPLVEAWRRERRAGEPLIFVGGRLESAAFYSNGQARTVPGVAQLRPLIGPPGAFVALPAGGAARLQDAGATVVSRLGRFGAFELVRMVPGPALPEATVPAPLAQ